MAGLFWFCPNRSKMELVGLVPAAGLAKRLGKIDSSKEVLPLWIDRKVNAEGPEVFSEYLLNMYKKAGVKHVHFIIRKGKWDIPEYFGNGSRIGLPISYLMMQHPYGVPFTLNEAFPFITDKLVVLGFPDMVVTPSDAFLPVVEKLKSTDADVVLGIFPIETKEKWDMVEIDNEGRITDIIIKKKGLALKYGWSIAAWKPVFTQFLHDRIENILNEGGDGTIATGQGSSRELYPGDLFREAIQRGLNVESVVFEGGECMDLGTIDDLERFRSQFCGTSGDF